MSTWTRSIEFTRFVVVKRRSGTDHIMLQTTLPSPFPPEVSNDSMHFVLEVRKGNGVEYLCEHFNLSPEDIEVIDGA
jgi:hypothetical protein